MTPATNLATNPVTNKVRRVDYYPDEMISGVAGKLSPLDFGVYWMICTLIASRGGPIDNDPAWIAQLFKRGTRPSDIRASIARLVAARKCAEAGGKLSQPRMELEVGRAAGRIQSARENGARGGRPGKQNNGLSKAAGSAGEKPTANRQPATSTAKQTRDSLHRESDARTLEGGGSPTVSEAGSSVPPSESAPPPTARRVSARGSRLPDDWLPGPQARRTAKEEGLSDAEIDRCADKFRDYWHAQPGARGRKSDWSATWRNWVRREVDEDRFGRRFGGGAGCRAGEQPGGRPAGGAASPAGGGAADRSFAASVARAVQRQAAEPADEDGSG
ncbi:hypothetical protein [Algihabitans albus]|uniref:hypothetical protein n=1 Tax=Algihabitans albus TaxID=2164067 RepID=UPI001ABC43AE|nr:hypothetical protein [Algihabitans albus]